MTKPQDFASFKALWEKHQIKLLQDGAKKCFFIRSVYLLFFR